MFKNRVMYVAVLLILFYLAMIFFQYGLYVLLYLCLLIPVAALLWMLLLRKRIRFAWSGVSADPRRGGTAEVAIAFSNSSFLPTGDVIVLYSVENIFLQTKERNKQIVSLSGRRTTLSALSIRLRHSGTMRITVDSVRVQEPLGLFSFAVPVVQGSVTCTVMPQMEELAVCPIKNNPYAYIEEEVYSKVKPGDDPAELFGVREYVPGDRQNRIHWNLTAKQDELMVKQMGLPEDWACLLLLEMYRPGDDLSEAEQARKVNLLMDTAFSLSASLIREGHRHRIVWFEEQEDVLFEKMIEAEEDVFAAFHAIFDTPFYPGGKTGILSRYFSEYPESAYKNIYYVSDKLFTDDENLLRESRRDAFVTCYLTSDVKPENEGDEWQVLPVRDGHIAEDLIQEVIV